MRVFHVQTDSGLTGGISAYISALVRSPRLARFEFTVVVPERHTDVKRASALYGSSNLVLLPRTYGATSFLRYVNALHTAVIKEKVAIIHAHALRAGFASALVAWRTGVPLVYTNHGLRFTQKRSIAARWIFLFAETLVARAATRVVCIRSHDTAMLASSLWLRRARPATITTRIDAPVTGRLVSAFRTGCRPVLVAVGSLIEVKRPDRFLDWVEALTLRGIDADARWIGDGPLRPAMELEAKRRRLSISWCGQLDTAAVAKHLSEASLLLVTSEFEVFPLAVLEAYATGVPVVCGGFDGIEDFVLAERTGILVDPDDPVQVAQRVEQVLSNVRTLAKMRQHARTFFEQQFEGANLMAAAYSDVYGEAFQSAVGGAT